MRVVFVNRFFYPDLSATSQLLSDLAFELASSGSDVHVLASRLRYDAPTAWLPAMECVKGVHVHRVRTSRFGRRYLVGRAVDYLTFYVSAACWLLRHLHKGDVLVIKTDPPLLNLIAAPVARLRGAKVVNWIQDLFPEVARELGVKLGSGPFGRLLERARDAALRSADANVALGDRMRSYLVSRGVPKERIEVIHNWANGSEILPLAREANSLRHQWGLQNKFIVGYSGNLGRAHDFDAVLKVAEALAHRRDIVFLMIGEGHAKDALEQAVRSKGLHQVRFEPYQPQHLLPQSLTLFDVHLVSLKPALEGLIVPSKLYGALAAGRPVIFLGEENGEAGMVLKRSDCGVTVDPQQPGILIQAIQSLYDDRESTERLGRNARTAFEKDFTRQLALERWRSLLERCAHDLST